MRGNGRVRFLASLVGEYPPQAPKHIRKTGWQRAFGAYTQDDYLSSCSGRFALGEASCGARYDVLYHTDLSRSGGFSGGTDLSKLNWSVYDLVVIDESHNFRNGGDADKEGKENRYVKLPSSFFISTPVGHYNPDWAIAFTEGSVRHIFFVAETKGNTDSLELRGVEKAKIECAHRHFAAISNEEVVYEVVDSFEKLMQKVI